MTVRDRSADIAGGAADSLALIIIANQFDPLFTKPINDFLMKAKLKYPPLSELMASSLKEVDMWERIRAIEDACKDDGSIGVSERYALINERTNSLHEDYRELQRHTANLKREIIDLIKEEARINDDSDSK